MDSLTTVRKLKEKGVEVFFEKENIYTLDSKGELLITIMSSLAQEESRSISENITWGKRKQFADGKVFLPYGNFLGYDKGEDGNPRVNAEQAEIIKRIYSMYLAGGSIQMIADALTEDGIKTPGGNDVWSASTVKSILSNEKYKGSALLQKCFTTDFLTKKQKVNEGEVPQYYVEESHEAIIPPHEWQLVQNEMARRKSFGRCYRTTSVFSSRVFCGDCGGAYGSKTFNPGKSYERHVWRCLRKYDNEEKCKTPFVTADILKERFLEALNDVVGDREEFLEHFRQMYYSLLDNTKLEEELEACLLECDAVAEMNRQWIEENARNPMDPEKFIRRHNALVEKYEEHEAKANSVRSEIQSRLNKAEELSGFLFELRERDFFIEEFSDKLFLSCIERIVVNRDSTLSYEFKDGSIIKKNIK